MTESISAAQLVSSFVVNRLAEPGAMAVRTGTNLQYIGDSTWSRGSTGLELIRSSTTYFIDLFRPTHR